ncbi:hypothetical protein HYDPIDRAFT_104531 [Hydnomerulius pinastri MD-312]|nr:hypothetical protein HYDPIDRAFT_104531 [Hydnomerulius pinastri MD-312]
MSPGLMRAREPFRLRNAITGFILAGFGVGVWAYSISAVKQDDFTDVDEEAKEMMKGRGSLGVAGPGPATPSNMLSTSADADATALSTTASASQVITPSQPSPIPSSRSSDVTPRGILAPVLDRTFPRLLDPTRKTLVWGAPPLDNVGRLGLRSTSEARR